MIKVYSIDLNELSESDYTLGYSLIDYTLKQRVDLKGDELQRCQSLAGYILLYRGAKEIYGKTNFTVNITKNGKLCVDFCYFSISHSYNRVVCAFCDTPIGIDIQKITKVKKREAYRFFNQKETDYVNSNESNISERYIEIFTKKEAAVKMLGTTLGSSASIDTFCEKFKFDVQKIDDFIFTICFKRTL